MFERLSSNVKRRRHDRHCKIFSSCQLCARIMVRVRASIWFNQKIVDCWFDLRFLAGAKVWVEFRARTQIGQKVKWTRINSCSVGCVFFSSRLWLFDSVANTHDACNIAESFYCQDVARGDDPVSFHHRCEYVQCLLLILQFIFSL